MLPDLSQVPFLTIQAVLKQCVLPALSTQTLIDIYFAEISPKVGRVYHEEAEKCETNECNRGNSNDQTNKTKKEEEKNKKKKKKKEKEDEEALTHEAI